MVTGVFALTVLVVIENVALEVPARTVTLAGTCAESELLESPTTVSASVLLVKVTVPVEDWPPVNVDGLTLTDCMVAAPSRGGAKKYKLGGAVLGARPPAHGGRQIGLQRRNDGEGNCLAHVGRSAR